MNRPTAEQAFNAGIADYHRQSVQLMLRMFATHALTDQLQDELVWKQKVSLPNLLRYDRKTLVFYNGAAAQAVLATEMRRLSLAALPLVNIDETIALFNRDDNDTRRLMVRQPSLSHGVSLYADRVVWVGPTGEYGDALNAVFWQSLARARTRPGGRFVFIPQYVYPEYV